MNQEVFKKIAFIETKFNPNDKEYMEIKFRLNELANQKQTDKIRISYNYQVKQYVEYMQLKTPIQSQRFILPQLRGLCKLADLKIPNVCKPPNLDIECESKCAYSTSWKNSFFCQTCARLPIAQFMEQIEITKNVKNYDDYLFAKMIWNIVKTIGLKVGTRYDFMCTPAYLKNCENCQDICIQTKNKFGQEWKIYASGLRCIDEAYSLALKLKMFDITSIVIKLQKFIKMVEVQKVATWDEVNDLIELLDLIPFFIKRAISTSILEPQGIRLFGLIETKKPNLLQIWFEKFIDGKLK